MICVVPPFGSSRSDHRRDVCNVNVGITLALVLTVILITVQAYRFLKLLISKIQLVMAARFTAAHPASDDDDDDDSFFDRLNNSNAEEVTGDGDAEEESRLASGLIAEAHALCLRGWQGLPRGREAAWPQRSVSGRNVSRCSVRARHSRPGPR